MKFLEMFRFEVFYLLRRPSTWLYILFLTGCLYLVLDEMVNYAKTVESVHLFSPFSIAELFGFANKFGLLILAGITSDTGFRDIQTRLYPLIYTCSVSKTTYHFSRISAIWLVASILQLVAVTATTSIATLMVNDVDLGVFHLNAFLDSILYLLIPNIFIQASLFYSLLLMFRYSLITYLGAMLVFLIGALGQGIAFEGSSVLGQLIDPSASALISLKSYTLTLAERNYSPIHFSGVLAANRVIWLVISICIGIINIHRFRFSNPEVSRPIFNFLKKKEKVKTENLVTFLASNKPNKLKKLKSYEIIFFISWHYFTEIMRSGLALIFILIPPALFLLFPFLLKGPLDVPLLPTSRNIFEIFSHPIFKTILILILGFSAGQLIWRERDSRIHEITDATKVSNTQFLGSKLLVLVLLILTVQLILLVTGLAYESIFSSSPIDWQFLSFRYPDQFLYYFLFVSLSIIIHVHINHKYLGNLLLAFFCLFSQVPSLFGIENKLLIFASGTGLSPSDFFTEHFFLIPWALYKLYWIGICILLLKLTQINWIRGHKTNRKPNLKNIFSNWKFRQGITLGTLMALSAGTVIFLYSHVFNPYETNEDREFSQLLYEKNYGSYKGSPHPQLRNASLEVELYPEDRKARIDGKHVYVNTNKTCVEEILVTVSKEVITSGITLVPKANLINKDNQAGVILFKLEKALKPNDSLVLSYSLDFLPAPFDQSGISTQVMDNGSWIPLSHWIPFLGYQTNRELQQGKVRQMKGLPEQKAGNNFNGTYRVRLDMVIGTSSNQIAVTSGSLTGTWKAKNRNYYRYQSEELNLELVDLYSAAYAVRKDRWNDISISIFHHPEHLLNVSNFMEAAKASLANYSSNFGNYRGKDLKLVEYADQGTGGISLAGCIGFTSKLALLLPKSPKVQMNLPFAVIAHEIAHQWWGHQVFPARTPGGVFLTESFAWYSALDVIEQSLGKFELDGLLAGMRKSFLQPRSRANQPLLEANDYFLAYRKGPLAMYALKEYIGKESINQAMRNLLDSSSVNPAYRPSSSDFFASLKQESPDSLHYLIDDLLKFNTFWELETKKSEVSAVGNEFETKLEITAKKLTVDIDNLQEEVSMDSDWIEVGLKSDKDSMIYLQKHRIKTGRNILVIRTNMRPKMGGIDPRQLLMDTEAGNNWRLISHSGS